MIRIVIGGLVGARSSCSSSASSSGGRRLGRISLSPGVGDAAGARRADRAARRISPTAPAPI